MVARPHRLPAPSGSQAGRAAGAARGSGGTGAGQAVSGGGRAGDPGRAGALPWLPAHGVWGCAVASPAAGHRASTGDAGSHGVSAAPRGLFGVWRSEVV
jgi:hypothetical protein